MQMYQLCIHYLLGEMTNKRVRRSICLVGAYLYLCLYLYLICMPKALQLYQHLHLYFSLYLSPYLYLYISIHNLYADTYTNLHVSYICIFTNQSLSDPRDPPNFWDIVTVTWVSDLTPPAPSQLYPTYTQTVEVDIWRRNWHKVV